MKHPDAVYHAAKFFFFADELSAFSVGAVDSPDSADDTEPEEEGKSWEARSGNPQHGDVRLSEPE